MTSRSSFIERFHATTSRAVLAVTGGGSQAIADLLAMPGASRTILEAVVPYCPAALDQWLGRKPENYCSRETALNMASVAWWRAKKLARETSLEGNCLGAGCTASLVSDRPKRGDHRCWIAVQSDRESRLMSLTMSKGMRTRSQEERLVADLILSTLSDAAGLGTPAWGELLGDETVVLDVEAGPDLICRVRSGESSVVWSWPGRDLSETPPEPVPGLLSGSFHPLHQGHLKLRDAAADMLGGGVAFEMPLINADKPPLDFFSIAERRRQFTQHGLAMTGAPLFEDKARLFPGVAFVVGFDTAERLLQPRFYDGGDEGVRHSLEIIQSCHCRFLVAGRQTSDGFQTLNDLQIPDGFQRLFESIPEEKFRSDLSSTAIRRQALQADQKENPQ